MIHPVAEKKLRSWVRSRHLICSCNYFVFESPEYTSIELFGDCIGTFGGSLSRVQRVGKIQVGNRRQLMLYRAKASLLIPNHSLKQYWIRHGSFHTRFDTYT